MRRLLFLLTLMMLCVVGTSAQTDVTSQYLQNANLMSLNGWSISNNRTDWRTDGSVAVIEWFDASKIFHLTQTVTLPAGSYTLTIGAFYREGRYGDGTNTKVYMQAGDKTQFVHALTAEEFNSLSNYTGNSDLYRAANAFSLGDFSNTLAFTLTEEQEITLGVQGNINTSSSWFAIGPMKLYQYTLEDYLDIYRTAVSQAQTLYEKPMSAATLATLQAAVVTESTLTTIAQAAEATETLRAAINAANLSIQGYEQVSSQLETAYNYAEKCYANGAPHSDALDAIQTAYNDRSIADEDINDTLAEINSIMMAIGQSQTSWPRLEPAMPRTQALESGKIYYLLKFRKWNPVNINS